MLFMGKVIQECQCFWHRYQLGIVHYRLDQFKESEQHFEAALAIQKIDMVITI